LSGEKPDHLFSIASHGGVKPLVGLLTIKSTEAQSKAVAVLSNMSRDSKEIQTPVAKEGALQLLVGMLDPSIPYMSGDDSLQAAGAAAAAVAVATVTRERRNSIELVISTGEVNIVASRGLEARSEAAGTLWSLSRNNMANSQVSASECLRVPLIANSQVITCIVPQIHELFTNPTLMNSDDR